MGRRRDAAAGREPACIVGIGASAGCLPALKGLLAGLPEGTGMAFVVVVHLSPEHESHLAELLQPASRMPVRQVTRTMALEPDMVYVIPPNANLSAIDSHLRLSELEAQRRERAPIDHFLRTLATTHDGLSVGVILTGAGSDGTLGLRWIRERGGMTIAQQPEEAEFDSMPRTAIASGAVDIVARVAEIPQEIVGFCGTRPRLPASGSADDLPRSEQAALQRIVEEVRRATDHDLDVYRSPVLLRRIERRMKLRHVETLSAYLDVLRLASGEPQLLMRDLALRVPEFFGEDEGFRCLAAEVVPRLLERREPGASVRVWTIGCSTGEVAYSLAMLLIEEVERRDERVRVQVFATDLSEADVARARAGVYPKEVAGQISPERLARFFRLDSGHYRLGREVLDRVVFSRHDVLRDPPFSNIDLAVCRDLLRDLEPGARSRVLGQLAFALEHRGLLLLGADQRLGETPLFEPVDEGIPLYRRREGADARREAPHPPSMSRHEAELAAKAAHGRMTESHGPASVLLDREHRVVHFSARAGRFVRLPGGTPTRDILRLVSLPLRSALAAGLARVAADGRPWRSAPLLVETDEGTLHLALRLVPDAEPPGEGRFMLLFFEDLGPPPPRSRRRFGAPSGAIARLSSDVEQQRDRLGSWLRQRIDARAKDSCAYGRKAKVDEADEDLRLAVEELEASREELQSANEELLTLDAENRRQVHELTELTADLQHLLASTGIATFFLDRELALVRFTPPAGETFHVRHSDRGRPFMDLGHGLRHPQLPADAESVLATLRPVEREVETEDGRWYLARLLPYRSTAEEIAGLVLSLVDVTDRRRAEEELRAADRRKDEFLAQLAHELRNPLAPIVSGISVLRATDGDPRLLEEVTATMERQARQLVRLVDDLLEVSRITSGRLQLARSSVDLADVLRDAAAAVRPQLEAARHELAVRPPRERILLDADPVRLTQVVANLLSNAVRYTPPGGHVVLSAERTGDEAVIVVEDDGIGIPGEMLERIFEPFTQLAEARRSPTSGLGIGLTLARSLVEMHGGRITAASAGPGAGSEFTVRLPIPAGAPAPARPEEAPEPAGGPRSVLVVDDNADAATTLALLLKSLGHADVRTATGGDEALRVAAERPPEVMLVDLRMPGTDGFEVARRVRAAPWGGEVVLVALSGWGQEEHRERARAAGFAQHLTKPAGERALRDVLALRVAAGGA